MRASGWIASVWLTWLLGGGGAVVAGSWEAIGPEGGVVYALAADPSARSTVYAATASGVYKSIDAGVTWRRSSDGLTHLVGALAVDPKTPSTVYAAQTLDTLLPEAHIFVSRDAGAHWQEHRLPGPANDVLVDGDGFVYTQVAHGGGLLWRSGDRGAHWQSLPTPWNIFHFAADPVRHLLFAWSVGRLYRSADHGRSWEDLSKGAPSAIGWCTQIAAETRPRGHLFMAIAADFDAGTCRSPAGVTYGSDDGGQTWVRTGPGGFPLAVGPHNEVYAGRFRSFDRGRSWQAMTAPPDDFGVWLAGPSRAVLLAGSKRSGVLRSADGGASWRAGVGMRAASVQAVAVDAADARHMVAYSWDRGFQSTRDGGGHWRAARCTTPGVCAVQGYLPYFLSVTVDPLDADVAYLTSADGFRRTRDGGRSIARVDPPSGCLQFQSFSPDPWSRGRLYATGFLGDACTTDVEGCTAFASDDGGDSWRCLPLQNAQRILAAPSSPGTVYATSEGLPQEGRTFSVSKDGGESWSRLADVPEFSTFTVDPADERRLLAAANEGFWLSRDGGSTWVEVLDEQLTGEGLVVLSGQDPTLLVVASPEGGVRSSRDGGTTWTRAQPTDVLGILDHYYPVLAVDPSRAGKIYVGCGTGLSTVTVP